MFSPNGDQMPNWCHNRVSFYSDNEEQIKELYEIFNSDNVFQKIKPAPDWKNTPNEAGQLPVLREHKNANGEVFHRSYDFPDGKNDDRWYDWNVNNWGTKWDIDQPECDELDHNCFECSFETAWSPAEGIFYELRENTLMLRFHGFMMNQVWNLQVTEHLARPVDKLTTDPFTGVFLFV